MIGIDRPVILPEDNAAKFKIRVTVDGVRPIEDRFVVLRDSLKANAIGHAAVSGVTAARVQSDDDAVHFATVGGDPSR